MRVVPNTAMRSVLYFCGYWGVDTAQGVCVAASTVGATMPKMLCPASHSGQPILLQRARSDACRRIAAEQHQLAAATEQGFDAIARQGHDLVGGPIAVRHVAVIAEVDESDARKALRQGAKAR